MRKIVLLIISVVLFLSVAAEAAEIRVAVLPFRNLMQKEDLNWLSEGIASTITAKLGNVKGLSLVERSQLQVAIKELGLQHAGVVDDNTAVKAGKILGVQVVVIGEFQVVGDQVRISARFVEVQTAKVASTSVVTGSFQNIFTLQDDVSFSLAKSLNVDVPEDVKKDTVKATTTKNLTAYEYYSKGNDAQWNQKDIEKAIDYYLKAINIDPNYENALFELGYIYNDLGEYKKAIEYYTRSNALNPKAKDTANNIGLAYSRLGDYPNAEKWYKKSLELEPNYDLALNGLGLVMYKQKKLTESEYWYKKTIQANPKYHLAYYNLGILYEDQKNYDLSISYYKKALEVQPTYTNAMINLGLVLETTRKDFAGAETWYKRALEVEPNNQYAFYNLGFLYNNKENGNYNIDTAIYYYQQAIVANPKYDLAYFYLGKLYTEKKEYPKAINSYEKAMQLYDKDPAYSNNLGWVYELQKNYVMSERFYRKATEVDSSYGLAWENLGYSLYFQKKDDDAVAAWKKAASLNRAGAKDALKKYYNIIY
ncbi:MAG: tetratricopeptide repeat protein [Nitrospiraceae bacterium]|nr:tetratricopeptide repeat protein [Nitrospiraceae bacterium]